MSNHPNRKLATRIDRALREAGLRSYVNAIEPNPATRGEVVLWIGNGVPVYSVEQALSRVRAIAASE